MQRSVVLTVIIVMLSACSAEFDEIGRAPRLSPVGSGLDRNTSGYVAASYPAPEESTTWIGGPADLFRDKRARKAGDIVTVEISIDDKASLSNVSNRSRKSKADADLAFNYEVLGTVEADLSGGGKVNSNTSSSGQGATERSEKVRLSIAAVVTDVLPNGFLIVNGTQEIQVNFETRVLGVGGVVDPRDISDSNIVPYEKIAEARVSYGGRGRLTEVQQPGWGQQVWDAITPF